MGQSGGSKTDTLIKLVLVFFISLLSFSIGTFVGKQFSDSQHRMAAMEHGTDGHGVGTERDLASVPSQDIQKVSPDEILTHEDIERLAKEFEQPSEPLARSGEHDFLEADTSKMVEEAKPKLDKIQNVADRIAKGKTPEEIKPTEPNRLPNALPQDVAAAAVGKWTIQISSHKAEDTAKKVAEDWKSKGHNAFYIAAKVNGEDWYRVNIGLFADKKAASDKLVSLTNNGAVKSGFIKEIVK
ncbi:MAG: hypothetical protein COT74_07400 [Bdellovibrionales bacterium CG10_big_fil_rev_8_21_14_0_10_45_34]|nr:MAG: hypothetical protein COT74_07400 [Bdellovibrionales bacterium CG10_big_fil_rev_8_21_14_0_10_45_34]